MSDFIRHAPCPKCKSKDNLALYRGGSGYCFGCGFVLSPTVSPYLIDANPTVIKTSTKIILPSDFQFGTASVDQSQWINTYGITGVEILQRKVGSSKQTNQLIFCWYGDNEELLLYQARNFSPFSKLKYFTKGKSEDVIPIYYRDITNQSRTESLVLVEDALSAIKIARQSDSMPCLSSDLSLTKLKRLARLYGSFTVWLDSDMYPKAQRMARRLQLMGCEARAVWTSEDPKVYQNEEISKVLLTGGL